MVLGGSLAGGVTFAAGAAGAGGWELFSMAGSSKFTLHGKAAQLRFNLMWNINMIALDDYIQ